MDAHTTDHSTTMNLNAETETDTDADTASTSILVEEKGEDDQDPEDAYSNAWSSSSHSNGTGHTDADAESSATTQGSTPPSSPSPTVAVTCTALPPPKQNPWGKISVPSLPDVNDNGNDNYNNDNNDTRGKGAISLSMIMSEQANQQDSTSKKAVSASASASVSVSPSVRFQENPTNIPDEEEMIRLAIEASLKESEANINMNAKMASSELASTMTTTTTTTSAAIGERDYEEDGMDEDLRLALQLSMAEMNMNDNTCTSSSSTCNDDVKMKSTAGYDYEHEHEHEHRSYDAYVLDRKQPPESSHNDTYNDLDLDGKPKAQDRHASFGIGDEMQTTTAAASISASASASASLSTTSSVAAAPVDASLFLTEDENEQIARAIMEADDKIQAESLKLAMELQEEENKQFERMKLDQLKNNFSRSNVRTVTRDEFDEYAVSAGSGIDNGITAHSRQLWGQDNYDDHQEQYAREIHHQQYEESNIASESSSSAGYQMNAATPSKDWSRLDRNTILGPNNELRTKHDVKLKNQSNAERLLGGTSSGKSKSAKKGGNLSVSDKAFNSFNQSLKNSMKRGMVKGVERSGTGRAENMNEKTRGGAMDGNVRLLITKAINNGLIRHCNGIVKEGKEAVVYHADSGSESHGFDVAVKVFKRIQEFKNRNMYIDNDPRYYGKKFKNANKREQVELWAEKEYRNLLRAQRAGVAVPTPLMQKDNVLFMRFLGDAGWPAAQLREVEMKKRSKKWTVLYTQTIVAMRKLYHCARLVHGDLSEFNILVCPMSQVENAMDKSEDAKDNLQIVLIDFGQAVERKHPSAVELLKRDLSQINSFFSKQDIVTLNSDECYDFVVEEMVHDDDDNDDCGKETDNNVKDQVEGEWRHNVKGWSDERDLQRFETLVKAKKGNKLQVDLKLP